MKIQKFDIFTADLNPRMGTEPGKTRPVVVIQTDLLNNVHPSTIICPLTTNIKKTPALRINISKKESGLNKSSDIMVDQVRAIDNQRLKKKIGKLSTSHQRQLLQELQTIILE